MIFGTEGWGFEPSECTCFTAANARRLFFREILDNKKDNSSVQLWNQVEDLPVLVVGSQ
jgi:hypothetical protein